MLDYGTEVVAAEGNLDESVHFESDYVEADDEWSVIDSLRLTNVDPLGTILLYFNGRMVGPVTESWCVADQLSAAFAWDPSAAGPAGDHTDDDRLPHSRVRGGFVTWEPLWHADPDDDDIDLPELGEVCAELTLTDLWIDVDGVTYSVSAEGTATAYKISDDAD